MFLQTLNQTMSTYEAGRRNGSVCVCVSFVIGLFGEASGVVNELPTMTEREPDPPLADILTLPPAVVDEDSKSLNNSESGEVMPPNSSPKQGTDNISKS